MLLMSLAAAALAAQTAATPPQPPSQAAKTPDAITITGCVERADQMKSPASTVGTTTDSMHFVLVNIPTSEAVGTSGTTSTGNPATNKGYRLDGDNAKLNPHVGHKVEITGYVDQAAATTSGSATSTEGPLVKVQTVKMLSETCGR